MLYYKVLYFVFTDFGFFLTQYLIVQHFPFFRQKLSVVLNCTPRSEIGRRSSKAVSGLARRYRSQYRASNVQRREFRIVMLLCIYSMYILKKGWTRRRIGTLLEHPTFPEQELNVSGLGIIRTVLFLPSASVYSDSISIAISIFIF